MLKIPHNIGEFSQAWLEKALGSKTGSLRSFKTEPIGTESGISGQLYRIWIDWDTPKTTIPRSVVVKLTSDQPERLAQPPHRAAFEREIRFYRDMAADCGVRTPVIYWSGIDATSGAAALVMEDLGHGTIYETGTAPIERIEAIVRAITPLHARWWNNPQLPTMGWLYPTDPPELITRIREAVPRVRPWYEKHAPALIPLMEHMPDAMERGLMLPRGSYTLIHGDLGLKNAAFIDDEVVLFDWQLFRYHTPGMELTELIKDSFGPVEPKELTAKVITVYHEALQAAGVTDFSLDELTDSFGQAVMSGIRSPLLLLGVIIGGPEREVVALRWATLALSLLDEFELGRRLRDALKQ